MIRKSSKESLAARSNRDIIYQDRNGYLFKQIQESLSNASQVFEYNEFKKIYEQIVKNCIMRSEVQKSQTSFLHFLKKLTHAYKTTLQIQVRILILTSATQINSNPEECLKLLTKVKHILIDTDLEYLLSKVFLIEARIYEAQSQVDMVCKFLKKCIDFSESYLVSSLLKHKEQVRKEITQTIIIAYFEIFKNKKQTNWKESEEYVLKAYKMASRNFGENSYIAEMINQIYFNHKNMQSNIRINISTANTKAITDIMDNQIRKNIRILGFYSWQDQKLVAQMVKTKNYEKQIMQETEFSIKLDFGKVKQLKSVEWVSIVNNSLLISEDEVFKVLEGNVKKDQTSTTRIGLKTITRDEIIKKQVLSSSSDDVSFIQKQDFNFIRRLGRAQSAKKKDENR